MLDIGSAINDELFHEFSYDETQYILLINDKFQNGTTLDIIPGLNETVININQYGYATGGYEITNIDDFHEKCMKSSNYIGYYNIKLPVQTKMIVTKYGFTVDRIIALDDMKQICELKCLQDIDHCKRILKDNEWIITYIKYLTQEEFDLILLEYPQTTL